MHRDLKPANIKVTPDGKVKVLDFGLAKALEPVSASSPEISHSPTLTSPALSQAGVILGTAAYMSPEQARGKPLDKRADIRAFGAVLYEMLSGQRAFAGGDVTEVLASVLAREPDWARLPVGMSPSLHTFIRRCLHKDQKQRVHDIADVRLAGRRVRGGGSAGGGICTRCPAVLASGAAHRGNGGYRWRGLPRLLLRL